MDVTGSSRSAAKGAPTSTRVRKCFRAAANGRDLVTFDSNDLLEAVGILKLLVADRRSGALSAAEPEHLLEARILRGALPVSSPDGQNLAPASRMGQFPAAYSEAGKARFIDAVLYADDTPWVIELKDLQAGRGSYLRHGIAQAVLYRRFLRRASAMYPYFSDLTPPLEPRLTRSAVAFPAFGSSPGGRETPAGTARTSGPVRRRSDRTRHHDPRRTPRAARARAAG